MGVDVDVDNKLVDDVDDKVVDYVDNKVVDDVNDNMDEMGWVELWTIDEDEVFDWEFELETVVIMDVVVLVGKEVFRSK